LSARSATGCVVHGLGLLPITSLTHDDETRRINGSVCDWLKFTYLRINGECAQLALFQQRLQTF